MPNQWILPPILTGPVDVAADLLRGYFDQRLLDGETPYWSGSWFERLSPGVDPDVVTSDDLAAVTMLGVSIPPLASLRMLERHRDRIQGYLRHIPTDMELQDAPLSIIGTGSPGSSLWKLLYAYGGMGSTRTSKLMARKRPRLFPIQDSVVVAAVGHHRTDNYWTQLQTLLLANERRLERHLHQIRSLSGVGEDISTIRVFDIVVWMSVPARTAASATAPGGSPATFANRLEQAAAAQKQAGEKAAMADAKAARLRHQSSTTSM